MFWTENTIPSHLDPDWTEELQLPPITKAQALAGIQPRWDLGENDDHQPIDEIVGLEYFAAHIATWAEFAEDERIFDAYHRPGRRIRRARKCSSQSLRM
jgi:hypothetical protein